MSAEQHFVIECPHCHKRVGLGTALLAPLLEQRRQDGRDWGGYRSVDKQTGKACRPAPSRSDLTCPLCDKPMVVELRAEVPRDQVTDPPLLVGDVPTIAPAWRGPPFRIVVAGYFRNYGPDVSAAYARLDEIVAHVPARSVLVRALSSVAWDWADRRGHGRERHGGAGEGLGPKNRALLDPPPDVVVILEHTKTALDPPKWGSDRREHQDGRAVQHAAERLGLKVVRITIGVPRLAVAQ